jgi:hypothetical protein
VQGKRLTGERMNLIDDLSIRPCEDYKRECLLSSTGLEYMGQVSHAYDGTQCRKPCDVPYCACAREWFPCPTGQCLPNRMSIRDCRRTLEHQRQRYSVNISRPDEDPMLDDKIYELNMLTAYMKIKIAYDKLAQYQEADMREFIVNTSLARDRFILECQWETGYDCSDKFTQRFTEMGLCYTFNPNSSNSTYSNAIGETAGGLQLTINTQSSAIIDKVGQNGLKVLLFDPSKDVELMSDYGINISPGFYTTIGVSLEQVTNMRAPYGTCDDLELRHTNDMYSYSRCVLDHETTSFMQECNCAMPYMPQRYVQCTTRDYLTCSHKLKPRVTKCPSHCNATVFNFKLSSTTLSTASTLNKFSVQQQLALQSDIELAHEAHSRVDYRHMSDLIQVFDNDLYKKLSLVESTVEEKIVRRAIDFFHVSGDTARRDILQLIYEPRDCWFGDAVETVDNFIYHVHRHGKALTGLINYTTIMKSRNQQNPLNINRLIVFAQATLEAVTFVNENGKQVQLELEQERCKTMGAKLFSCMDEFVNITSAIRFMLEHFFANHSNAFTTTTLFPNDDDLPCSPVCNVSDHGLNALLADIETLHSEYKHSEQTCFDPFERLISSIYHHNITLHDTNVTKKINFLLQLIDFRSVKSEFQSAVLDFLHKNVTRKDANTNLITMIENLAAQLASLKHAIRNLLQAILPQLVQEQRDEYITSVKYHLHNIDLLTAHFVPPIYSEYDNNRNGLVHYAIVNVVSSLTKKFIYEELNTTRADLTKAIYNRNSDGQISLHNEILVRTINERHFRIDKAADDFMRAMKVVHDDVIAQLRSLEHHLNGVLQRTTAYSNSLRIDDDNFVRDNIAVVKIYYTDMKIKYTDQSAAYSWSAFFSDLGGSLGLLLGASVLSLIEVLDMCFYNFTVYACKK